MSMTVARFADGVWIVTADGGDCLAASVDGTYGANVEVRMNLTADAMADLLKQVQKEEGG